MAGGDTEELEIMFRNMFQALFLAVIFIYLILRRSSGRSHPLAIMLSLPLRLSAAVMLFFTRDTLNIMSMIGLIMLMGLVTKTPSCSSILPTRRAAKGCRGTRRCSVQGRRVCGPSS